MNCLCRRTYWHRAARYEVAVWGSFLDAAFYRSRWLLSERTIGCAGETKIRYETEGKTLYLDDPPSVDMMQEDLRSSQLHAEY